MGTQHVAGGMGEKGVTLAKRVQCLVIAGGCYHRAVDAVGALVLGTGAAIRHCPHKSEVR
jgi:hypothetical protein